MNLPIPFRLSRIDEPVPYTVTDFRADCEALEARCDVIQRQLADLDRQLDEFHQDLPIH